MDENSSLHLSWKHPKCKEYQNIAKRDRNYLAFLNGGFDRDLESYSTEICLSRFERSVVSKISHFCSKSILFKCDYADLEQFYCFTFIRIKVFRSLSQHFQFVFTWLRFPFKFFHKNSSRGQRLKLGTSLNEFREIINKQLSKNNSSERIKLTVCNGWVWTSSVEISQKLKPEVI